MSVFDSKIYFCFFRCEKFNGLNKTKHLLFTLLFLISITVTSQDRKIVYPHSVFWHKTEVNEFFNEKFGVGADFVYRSKNEMNQGSMFDSHNRTSFRPWINYQFSKTSRFSVSPIGYMHTNEYIGKPEDYDKPEFHEWRSTLQFFHHYKHRNGKWMHTWRYRYEFRWQERPGNDDYRFLTRFRFRYRIRYMINSNDFYDDKTLYAMASNEIGLNIGKNVTYNTFNQNRLYIGVGYRFLNTVRAELRYVNRFRTRGATGIEFDSDNGFMLGIYIDQLSNLWKSDIQKVRFAD